MSATSGRFRSTLAMVLILTELQDVTVLCIDLRFLRKQTEGTTIALTTTTSAPTTATSPLLNCTEGVWSEWYEVLSCNAECGSCGSRVLRRNCTTTDCHCKGETRREERCNIQVCDYPKPACCPPFKLMLIEGEFACGPQDKNSLAAFTTYLRAKQNQNTRSSSPASRYPVETSDAYSTSTSSTDELLLMRERK